MLEAVPESLRRAAFPAAVAAYGVYNASVIVWELNKPGSRVCPKCARTRIALGLALAAAGGYLAARELL